MARRNSTKLPIRFFKIILQTNLQRLKIPNKFTRRHGVGLSNPVLINPPDGTKWKVYWKNINGEIWFEKGWKNFTQNYSLGHGCLVLFKYKEGTSNFNVLILGQNAVEIDYGPSCHTYDEENNNIDHSDDESVMILDELSSPRPHKEVRDPKKTAKKSSNTGLKSHIEESPKVVKGKGKKKEKSSSPSDDQLRNAICDILTEVDLNTATFFDVLKLLAEQFDVDLTPKKETIKLIIQKELKKLDEEVDDSEKDEEDV
ncbi:B3 domain-containing transcription factor VRN1 [Trifolium repens]|nr:B3 domain-containing transcription factor VRN1 [Trifolium repens]